MSFADELRNAPAEQARKDLQQKNEDWTRLIDFLYNYLKNDCKITALNNESSCIFYFSDGIRRVERMAETSEYGTIREWWSRISPRVCCCLSPNSEIVTNCLSLEDVDALEKDLQKRTTKDGLSIKFERKELQKYKLDMVYVKRSESERLVAGILNSIFPSNTAGLKDDDGEYKQRKVKDGFRYDLMAMVSW